MDGCRLEIPGATQIISEQTVAFAAALPERFHLPVRALGVARCLLMGTRRHSFWTGPEPKSPCWLRQAR
jgi:hypothetical protein